MIRAMFEPQSSELFATTGDGWRIQMTRSLDPARLDRARRPVLVVPGYGMNGSIFVSHPGGTAMVSYLAAQGLEVWTLNLRGQGATAPVSGDAPPPSLRSYAEQDLRAAIETVLARTESTQGQVDVLGCSLGGSITYALMALEPELPIGRFVAMASPLRWESVPLLLRLPFRSRRLAGLVPVRGTRRLAGLAMPVAKRAPFVVSLYLNTANIDLEHAAAMIEQTVEDPHPRVNADIARWMRARDMVLRGVNVTERLRRRREPLFVVTANRDGIVPSAASRAALSAWGGPVEALEVGDATGWYAHADLFVGREAPARVFAPIARFLAR